MLTRRTSFAAALAACGAAPAIGASVWRIVTEYPAGAIPGEGIAYFAETASRLAAGELSVQPSFDGIRSASMIDAVAKGQVQAADAFTGALAATAPIFQLSSLPFLTSSSADTARLLAAARPAYVAALQAHQLTLLYAAPWPATGIWSRRPLTATESLKGLRIRTYDAASTAVFQTAGAVPTQISFGDAMPRLRSGDLDAVLSSGDGGAGAKLWELLPNFLTLNYASPLSLAFCQTQLLEALPPPALAAVQQAARDTELRQFAAMLTRSGENETRMRANSVKIAEVHDVQAALREAAGPVTADWLTRAGPAGQVVMVAYRG